MVFLQHHQLANSYEELPLLHDLPPLSMDAPTEQLAALLPVHRRQDATDTS